MVFIKVQYDAYNRPARAGQHAAGSSCTRPIGYPDGSTSLLNSSMAEPSRIGRKRRNARGSRLWN